MLAFDEVYRQLNLMIDARKMQELYQPSPSDNTLTSSNIQLGGAMMENVNHLPYFDSHLLPAANIDMEINYRVRSTAAAFS